MAKKEHLEILRKGIETWNLWRQENPLESPDLSEANLYDADLRGANLSVTDLSDADLGGANLSEADLSGADFYGADFLAANLTRANLEGACLIRTRFSRADLSEADLTQADVREANFFNAIIRGTKLCKADLFGAYMRGADLSEADFTEADLAEADLCKTNLTGANLSRANLSRARIIIGKMNGAVLTGSRVFGISAWGITGLEEAEQSNLIITQYSEPLITVDNLEVAQFIYILLRSEKVRSVIDTITSKVVLILGRFTQERKAVLDAIREELRKHDYLPILFDFDEPVSRGITQTVSTLAHMARFVIADITDARCIPQELMSIVPNLPSVPVQPIILSSAREYAMVDYFKHYPWFLKIHRYKDIEDLLKSLKEKVIIPAEEKTKALQKT